MIIRFNQDYTHEVVDHIVDDEPVLKEIGFKKDEEWDVDLLDEHDNSINVQLPKGECAYGLPKEVLNIVSREEI